MKKILSVLIAIITILGISTVAFAHENVDNTFNNFTPGTGKTAPSNWYDPYCYDENGYILPDAISGSSVRYCSTARKIYTVSPVATTKDGRVYTPYRTVRQENIYIHYIDDYELKNCSYDYCPYCGLVNDGVETHDEEIGGAIVYGVYCTNCGKFNGNDGYENTTNNNCWNCHQRTLSNTTVYRFIRDEYRNQEYSWIFDESAFMWGEGVDGRVEDLEIDNVGYYVKWKNSPVESSKTFWDKIVEFFADIVYFFKNLF